MYSDVKNRTPPSQAFEGRTDILKKLDDCFSNMFTSVELNVQRRAVLHGMGGAGKTQISLKFAQDAADR